MRVHIIKEKTIRQFCQKHTSSIPAFEAWISKVEDATWKFPGDVKQTFRSADLLGNGTSRIVFNIGGNNYRMICKCIFGQQQVHLFVCWIGTHAEYTRLCDNNKQYTISIY